MTLLPSCSYPKSVLIPRAFHLSKEAMGWYQTPTMVAVGTDAEQGGRYGDFCDASPSYGNPSELWFACEYIINYNDYVWNTRVQQMFVTG